MKKCFMYYRVSSDKQLGGTGIERQEENLRAYVKRLNLCSQMDVPLPIELSDPGVSAFKGLNMSEGNLGKWMKEVATGIHDGSLLVLESIDRFSRQNPFTVMKYLSTLDEHDISIHDVSLGLVINRSNSSMLPIVAMSAQRAYEESKYKSTRISDGWQRKRITAFEKGTVVTNKRPLWIDVVDDYYVLNEKAEIVREIFRLYQTGIGCPTIAKILQAKGDEWRLASPKNRGGWRAESVYKILTNKRVTGVIFITQIIRDFDKYDTDAVQKKYERNVYPEVISMEEFELVQKMLESRNPKNNQKTIGRVSQKNDDGAPLIKSNIFTSVFRCGRCHEGMYHNVVTRERYAKRVGETVTSEYRYIRCIAERDKLCDNKSLRYEVLEQFIIEHIKNLNFTQIIKSGELKPEIELLQMKIKEEQEHISDYEQGIEKLKSKGKKVPFDALVELEESQTNLKAMQERLNGIKDVSIDTEVLTEIDIATVFDVENIELRSRIEYEISKIIDRIELVTESNHYICTLHYKDVDVLKHVLIIQSGKKPKLASSVSISREVDETHYKTPSFELIVKDNEFTLTVLQNVIVFTDYALLLNYVDTLPGSKVLGVWMREHFNEVLANSVL